MSEDQANGRPFAAGLLSGISGRLGDLWWAFMVRGVLAAVLGLCALIWPSASLGILIALVGLYCLADGVTGLVGAFRAAERGPNLLQAALGVVAGAVLLFWPGASIRTLLVVFGVWAAFTGVSQILAARRADLAEDDRRAVTTIGWVTAALGLVLIVWPGTGVVAISWVIALAALLLAGLLIFLALRLKRLQGRVDTLGEHGR